PCLYVAMCLPVARILSRRRVFQQLQQQISPTSQEKRPVVRLQRGEIRFGRRGKRTKGIADLPCARARVVTSFAEQLEPALCVDHAIVRAPESSAIGIDDP